MSIDANTGSIITQQQAQDLVRAFDVKFPGQIVSSFIGANNVKAILNQEDCIGIRIYNGYNDTTNQISLVLLGVNSTGGDMLADGIIYDDMSICPRDCPTGTSLM
uniref:hypothetical protein n=1 Tax=Flavobacterium sp. TaxID=239 RepID=UPI00404A0C58